MKFKNLLEDIFTEEKILRAFEYKKVLSSQSYYLMLTNFKVSVLLQKQGLENNKRHWVNDELIGNSLNQLIMYYDGALSEDDIFNSLIRNFNNNYIRFLKDIKVYNKYITKEDVLKDNVLKETIKCYKKFAKWVINNKNKLKGVNNTFDLRCDFYNTNY